MSLLSMIPGRSLAYVGAVVVLAGAGAGVVWWGLSPRIDLAEERAAWSAQGLEKAHEMIQQQGDTLQAVQAQAEQVNEISRNIAKLRQDVARYNSAQDKALEELRQNDKNVEEYLRGPVPAALGRLYERPETTDPAAYGSPAVMRVGPLPATGQAGDSGQ